MSDYLNKTEEQQFEEAKSWLKQNGMPILMAIILALAASAGWNFWKNHQVEVAQKTSASYQQVMESYLQNPEKNTPLVEKFIADNQATSYAVFAQLEQAKQLVDKQDFAVAKNVLNQAIGNTDDATLKNVIRFRLAAVEFQLQQFDAALATLAKIQDNAWDLRKQVFVGDILAAKGDKEAAKSAYEQAKASAPENEHMLIDIRLNNL
ncbi:putative negative regulator of RcsB-dependent stress response [Bibersteinia trehalosi]|uniref:YfgM family protein n=1 Tax=Bibersteinia trehalosi TaxID=47735 RepID=UPI00104372D2|nr:tetratricopeptide repeat protein [Bibersteinia trehalosi]TCT13910.1 putative negative regulator of RcsB-dependent stress response [Bibersteinia trehalosi]